MEKRPTILCSGGLIAGERPESIRVDLSAESVLVTAEVMGLRGILWCEIFSDDHARTPGVQVETEEDFVIHSFGVNGEDVEITGKVFCRQNGIQSFHDYLHAFVGSDFRSEEH